MGKQLVDFKGLGNRLYVAGVDKREESISQK